MPAIPSTKQTNFDDGANKIDLKKISKRLTDLNLNKKPTTEAPVATNSATATKTTKTETEQSNHSHFETEMIDSLNLHSEHLIDSQEWSSWNNFFISLQSTRQFRQLHHLPIDSRYILVRESHEGPENESIEAAYQRIRELRVAVIGNVDAGKSTVLGVLSRGGLDDGRGRARVHCNRHRHENESGRTSSVSQELLGYTLDGNHLRDERSVEVAGYEEAAYLHKHHKMTWEMRVGKESWKCISLIDLAGHEKYLKTTMFGLTGYCPDIAMLMVGANTGGLIGTSKEHLALAAALAIPVIVVVTKIDLAPEGVRTATLAHINKILKSPTCKKMPLMIRSIHDLVHVIRSGLLAANQICPIFEVSNVTGQGIDFLRLFFNLVRVPDAARDRWEANATEPTEYQINETYTVPGVGTVVSGVVTSGSIRVGDSLLLGPTDHHGRFIPTVVRGIQRKRISLAVGATGQAVSLALKKIKRSEIRYGMALISSAVQINLPLQVSDNSNLKPRVCREFTALVVILYHSTTITTKYQAMLHCGTIRQTVQIVAMSLESDSDETETQPATSDVPIIQVGRTGDRARIRFKFLKQPEMLKIGTKILFREGRTRGMGKIFELH